MTIPATTTWTGRYSVDGANFLPITGTATSTPATSQIHIQQSRTVLVPNPTTIYGYGWDGTGRITNISTFDNGPDVPIGCVVSG